MTTLAITTKTAYVTSVVKAIARPVEIKGTRLNVNVPSYLLIRLDVHMKKLRSKAAVIGFCPAFRTIFDNIEVLHCALLMARG